MVRLISSRDDAPLAPALNLARIAPADRPLRIILVSQYFAPEVGATQTRIQTFAEYLSARGHAVTVIAEFPNHPHGVIPDAYRGRVVEDDRSNPYRILRVWVKASRDKTRATRLSFYGSYSALATAVAALAGPADVVLATTPPLFAGAAGLAIARLKRAPFVLDVRDLWPAAATGLGELRDGWCLRGAHALERHLYRAADAVVAVTRPFCDHISVLRARNPRPIYIPNGTLETFFVAADRSARSALAVSDDDYVVMFAGTHGIAQALPSVLDAAEHTGGRIVFVLVGEGPVKAALRAEALRRGLKNVRFHPQVALRNIPRILGASDALLVPLSAHPAFASFVPSKLFDYMAVGKPVLVAAAGEAAAIVERARAGLVIPPETPEALTRAAEWLAEHPDEARAMGERGRLFARSRSRRVEAERLERLLSSVARCDG